MSQRFIDALKENIKNSTSLEEERSKFLDRLDQDTRLIRAGALLHDIMHIPFAHTIEDENGILEKGDKSERINKMLNRINDELDELKKSPELASHNIFGFKDQKELEKNVKLAQDLLKDVKKILWTIAFPEDDGITQYIKRLSEKSRYENGEEIPEEEKTRLKTAIENNRIDDDRFYIADIIGNTISADLLSYILRDVEFTGIEMKPGFFYRIFDYIELRQNEKTQQKNRLVIKLTKRGDWRHDVLSAIINILNVRFGLTEAVIYHHAKCEASAMLGEIAFLCNLAESDQLYNIGDEGLMSLLENKVESMSKISEEKENADSARKLLHCLQSRRFYKRFHIIPASGQKGPDKADLSMIYSFPKKRHDFERKIEKKFGLPPGSIIIFCPTGKMALKEAEALVVYEKMDETGQLQEAIEKLNSEQCLDNLKMRHESLADRVKNVMDQYMALWKLYIFIDPSIIPIYGAALKKELSKPENLGTSDLIFDKFYVSKSYEYEVSEKIEEEVRNVVPEPRIPEVYQEIPSAIQTLMTKKRSGSYFDWVRDRAKEIALAAKERVESKGKQEKLMP
jgi:HD superfamily phosphohydrolase